MTKRPAPLPVEVRKARLAAGLSQAGAGALIGYSKRGWCNWEYGVNAMNPALFELFRWKVARAVRISGRARRMARQVAES